MPLYVVKNPDGSLRFVESKEKPENSWGPVPNDAHPSDLEVISGEPVLIESKKNERKNKEKKKSDESEAHRYLESTNQYVLRFVETGEAIPKDIEKGRADARKVLGL